MIRSIAYELFDRLTTDPDALRKQLSDARADRDAVAIELADYQTGLRSIAAAELTSLQHELSIAQLEIVRMQKELSKCNAYGSELFHEKWKADDDLASTNRAIAEFRDRLQTIVDEQIGPQETLGFAELLTCVEDGLRKASRAEARRDMSELTVESTWILAMWSIHAEGWTESKRGSYDAMIAEMHRSATAWNLFPRSQWDALMMNGRAR